MGNLSKAFKAAQSFLSVFLVLTFLSSNGQQISTVAEIYNYDVGDIFHVREFGAANGGGFVKNYNFEITSKNYSSGNDTLFYTRYVKTAESSSENPEWVYDYYNDTVIYVNLDALINEGDIDTVYSDPDFYNERLINRKDYSSEYIQETFDWIVGCGGRYRWFYDVENNFSYYYELKYFKKGDEIWGEPLPVSTGPTLMQNTNLRAYPNPFHDILYLDLTNRIMRDTEAKIYSLSGNQIFSFFLKTNQINRVDLPELINGCYILKVNEFSEYDQLIIKN